MKPTQPEVPCSGNLKRAKDQRDACSVDVRHSDESARASNDLPAEESVAAATGSGASAKHHPPEDSSCEELGVGRRNHAGRAASADRHAARTGRPPDESAGAVRQQQEPVANKPGRRADTAGGGTDEGTHPMPEDGPDEGGATASCGQSVQRADECGRQREEQRLYPLERSHDGPPSRGGPRSMATRKDG